MKSLVAASVAMWRRRMDIERNDLNRPASVEAG